MDIISLSKAKKAIHLTKVLNEEIIQIDAESSFETIDHRVDYLEELASDIYEKREINLSFSEGTIHSIQKSEEGFILGQVISEKEEVEEHETETV